MSKRSFVLLFTISEVVAVVHWWLTYRLLGLDLVEGRSLTGLISLLGFIIGWPLAALYATAPNARTRWRGMTRAVLPLLGGILGLSVEAGAETWMSASMMGLFGAALLSLLLIRPGKVESKR